MNGKYRRRSDEAPSFERRASVQDSTRTRAAQVHDSSRNEAYLGFEDRYERKRLEEIARRSFLIE